MDRKVLSIDRQMLETTYINTQLEKQYFEFPAYPYPEFVSGELIFKSNGSSLSVFR